MWQKEVIELAFYAGGVGGAIAFAFHWLMQEGHPLHSFEQWIQRNWIAAPQANWRDKARYYLGMWLVGCSVCQSFWFGFGISLIFTSVPFSICFVAGFFAMVLNYKIY